MARKPVFLILVFLFIIACRLPLASIPITCVDEAIYATAAHTIVRGGVMYHDAVDICAPITPYIYAGVFSLFGVNNMTAVRMALLALVIATAWLVYALGRRIGGMNLALVACLMYAIFSYNFDNLNGMSFNTEWPAAFFACAGSFFLLSFLRKQRHFHALLSGACFGLAFFSKQFALFAFLPALVCGAWAGYASGKRLPAAARACGLLIAGFAVPTAIIAGYFLARGVFREFIFWFWQYHYTIYVPRYSAWHKVSGFFIRIFGGSFLTINHLLMMLFIAHAAVLAHDVFSKRRVLKDMRYDFYLSLWTMASLVACSWSGRFFPHYFIFALPALTLTAARMIQLVYEGAGGLFLSPLSRRFRVRAFFWLYIAAGMVLPFSLYLFVRARDGHPPLFARQAVRGTEEAVRYIQETSSAQDTLFVWGFFSQMYVFCDRFPASRYQNCNYLTGWIPLTKIERHGDTSKNIIPGTWEQCMAELEKNAPLYIVDTSVGNIYGYGRYSPDKFAPLAAFLRSHYTQDREFFYDGEPVMRLYKRK